MAVQQRSKGARHGGEERTKSPRRAPGMGSLLVLRDGLGRETWHGKWSVDGIGIKRRVGPKRKAGTREGLTRAQAEKKLRELMATIEPTRPASDALTMADLGQRYLANLIRRGRKKATTVALESILRIWLEPFFADRDVRRITVEDVRDLMRMMERGRRPGPKLKGDRRYGRPTGPKTVRNYIGTLSALLNFAERNGWVSANVARHVELPSVTRNEDIRFLEPVEVQSLADAAIEGPYRRIDRALYLTAAMTGLRQGELVALRWRDVDWTAGRIRVRRNYVLGEFGTPKSRRSTRSVPMADALAGELDRLHQTSNWPADGDLVFGDPDMGTPLDKAAILRRYRRALKATGLDESHRFHDLRHTFGTRMASTGVPMRTLQEWMGHRDIETTQRYADYAPSPHEAAFVEAAFGASDLRARPSSIDVEGSTCSVGSLKGVTRDAEPNACL
jgi:integrase